MQSDYLYSRPVATWKGSGGTIRPKKVGVIAVNRVPVPSVIQSEIEELAPTLGANERANIPQTATAADEIFSISSPASEVQIVGPPLAPTTNGADAGNHPPSRQMFLHSSDVQGRKYPCSPDGSLVGEAFHSLSFARREAAGDRSPSQSPQRKRDPTSRPPSPEVTRQMPSGPARVFSSLPSSRPGSHSESSAEPLMRLHPAQPMICMFATNRESASIAAHTPPERQITRDVP
ncbi:hypothetical protein PGT21_032969 [Puccinia graminis f. sp. tritici]|uniref:Uncharacterized protein n=1 Tax=Puccinia graminis f. sp. tritici TaxID=56615 RepID=A0A5B0NFK8_PUCGR|nr:hypothetical protein PGT21_032969 [Puccinia graminis f. sp. tritici]